MKQLREHPIADHPGKDHVVELLDDFLHEGPHGSHVCLVTKPMGRQLEVALSDVEFDHPVPYKSYRNISIQVLQALDYLHQQGVMHGDVHPGNLVLALTDDIDDDTEIEIEAKNRRGNELNDPDDPYALDDKVDVSAGDTTNTSVILVDLGASSTPADAPSDIFAYPIPYRAPEVVMDRGLVTAKADV